MFDRDQLIAVCQAALADSTPERAMRQVVERAVADPADVLRGLGEPTQAGIQPLLRSPELTILDVVWAPRMTLMPHDHRMWAVIGIYTGREDNIFWRRIDDAHVYGGEFFTTPRSEWDPETLLEQPFSVERALRSFAEANARAP